MNDNIIGISPYPLFGLIGCVLAYLYIKANIKNIFLRRKIFIISYFAIITGIVGAKIAALIVLMIQEKRLIVLKDIFQSGLVFYGGMIAVILYFKLLLAYLGWKNCIDIFVSAMPLFHAIARIGCYFAGCCYGKNGFPVQLLESFMCFIIFLLLNYMLKRGKMRNYIYLIYMMLYSILRFWLEFIRGDLVRGMWFGVSTSQYISLMVFIFTTYIIKRKVRSVFI